MPYDLNIPGWLNEADLIALESLARSVPSDGIIVEIGAWLGRSTYALAKSADPSVAVYTVDPWAWMPKEYPDTMPGAPIDLKGNPRTLFEHYTRDCPNIVAIQNESTKVNWSGGLIDLVFIDGMHQHPWIDQDIATWFPRIRLGGVICGDDYSPVFPAVIKAANELGVRTRREVRKIGSKMWRLI